MPLSANEPQLPELKQQAIDWLIRLRSDDLNDGEMYAFADWLSQTPAHSSAFAAAEKLFNDMTDAAKSPAARTELQTKASQPAIANSQIPPRKRPMRWLAPAFALAAAWLFAVILAGLHQAHPLDSYLSDYHTETGELRDIQLADGSRLLLNTDTTVSVDFNDSLRRITLHHGQARFTVAKDAQRPFEVMSDDLIVRALGTVFEVYNPDPGEISVTVQEHAVAARVQSGAQASMGSSVDIQQGQQLRYRPGSPLQPPEPVELSQTAAWQQHRLFINDKPLSELIEELNRYRSGRIFLSDEQLKNLRVTGVFSLDNPDDALNSVRKVLALDETRLGPWWILLHR